MGEEVGTGQLFLPGNAHKETESKTPHKQVVWIIAVFCAGITYLALSLVFIEADPPHRLPLLGCSRFSNELFIEAPAKAHEARNWALFGEWHRNPADEYQFWRVQAPLWVYPLAAAFRRFGVSYTTLRTFSVLNGFLGFFALLFFARRQLPGFAIAIVLGLYATNIFVTQLGRSGLIESGLGSWIALLMLFLVLAQRHPGWLVAALATFTIAFFQKAGAVLVLPVLLAGGMLAFRDWAKAGVFPRMRWVPVGVGLVLAIGTTVHMMQGDYQRVILSAYDRLVSLQDNSLLRNIQDPKRLDYPRFHWHRVLVAGGAMMPGIGALALPLSGWLWTRVIATRGRNRWELILGIWSAITWVMILAVGVFEYRYASLLFIPSYLVLAWGIAQLPFGGPHRRSIVWLSSVAVAGTLALQGVEQASSLNSLGNGISNCARMVQEKIGDRPAVIVGRFAMPLLLATPYDLFYIKQGFNTDIKRIRLLGITHGLFAIGIDWVPSFLQKAAHRFTQGRHLGSCEMNGLNLELVEFPLASAFPVDEK